MKKVAIILATTAFASASAANTKAPSFTGTYIGVNGGYQMGSGAHKTSNAKRNAGIDGLIGGLHIGFQKDFCNLVAGLEASADLTNTNGSHKYDDGDRSKLKHRHAYGVAARLGVKLNSWLVYAKLGYENGKFSSHMREDANCASKAKRLHAFAPGVGLETLLTNNWLLGVEYTHKFYEGKHFVKKLGNSNTKDHNKPMLGHVKVRLGYKL